MSLYRAASLFLLQPIKLDHIAFPTRRSSDLDVVHAVEQEAVEVFTRAVDGKREITATGACRSLGGRGGARGEQDRKSTRLNSSHLVISYAVFCLNKINRIKVNDATLALQ